MHNVMEPEGVWTSQDEKLSGQHHL